MYFFSLFKLQTYCSLLRINVCVSAQRIQVQVQIAFERASCNLFHRAAFFLISKYVLGNFHLVRTPVDLKWFSSSCCLPIRSQYIVYVTLSYLLQDLDKIISLSSCFQVSQTKLFKFFFVKPVGVIQLLVSILILIRDLIYLFVQLKEFKVLLDTQFGKDAIKYINKNLTK